MDLVMKVLSISCKTIIETQVPFIYANVNIWGKELEPRFWLLV